MSTARKSDIAALLESLAAGTAPDEAIVTALSDLDREGLAAVREHWPSIPLEVRVTLMSIALEMARERIHLDFQRLCLFAANDESADVRAVAVAGLDENGGSEVARSLARILANDTDADVLTAAAMAAAPYVLQYTFGQIDRQAGRDLLEALRAIAEDESRMPEQRGPAIEAVAPSDEYWVEDVIRDAYLTEERELRLAAIGAMGLTANEEWLEYLDEQLGSDDPEFRQRAAAAAGSIASEDAMPMLVELLEDENMEVQAAAVAALAEIGGDEVVEYLEDFQQRAPAELEADIDLATEVAKNEIPSLEGTGLE